MDRIDTTDQDREINLLRRLTGCWNSAGEEVVGLLDEIETWLGTKSEDEVSAVQLIFRFVLTRSRAKSFVKHENV